MSQYVVIGTNDCTYCSQAKNDLASQFGEYDYQDLSKKPWLTTLLQVAGQTTVPVIYSPDGNLIGGYEELTTHLNAMSANG